MEKGFTINVYPASEGGYMVDVYEQELMDLIETMMNEVLPDPDDGGHATGNLEQALEMAKSLALDLAGEPSTNVLTCEHTYDENGLCTKCNRLQTPEEYGNSI